MTLAQNVVARLLGGLLLSSAIGWLAYRRASLSKSGVAGAILTGTLIFGFGGWISGLLLIAFFVTSSALSHYKQNSASKRQAALMFDKGGRRDIGQALANGGAATSLAVLSGLAALYGRPDLSTLALIGFLAALATANADTWATELGVLSRRPPRLITHLGTEVAPGTSGGITLVGTAAAAAGAGFIGLTNAALQLIGGSIAGRSINVGALIILALVACASGLAGAMFDSLLGATVQAIYFDPRRNKETEKKHAADGSPNRHLRGVRWLNNDWVNFLASAFGGAVGIGLALALDAPA